MLLARRSGTCTSTCAAGASAAARWWARARSLASHWILASIKIGTRGTGDSWGTRVRQPKCCAAWRRGSARARSPGSQDQTSIARRTWLPGVVACVWPALPSAHSVCWPRAAGAVQGRPKASWIQTLLRVAGSPLRYCLASRCPRGSIAQEPPALGNAILVRGRRRPAAEGALAAIVDAKRRLGVDEQTGCDDVCARRYHATLRRATPAAPALTTPAARLSRQPAKLARELLVRRAICCVHGSWD